MNINKRLKKRGGLYLSLVSLLLIFLLAAFIWLEIIRNGPLLPKKVNEQLTFQALLPDQSQTSTTVDKSSFKYDKSNKVLTFVAEQQGTKLTIAEQSYPEVLIYDKLVGTMNEYAEIQAKIGKVALTKPKSLNGGQTAVLSTYNGTSGVLLFAKPDKNLTNDQWTQFFNQLQVSP